ncbi:MAG: phosphate signaling complex protein PhoU, partial [Moraxellaceae bacterium]|nr:phosphate signaling complex protein PhoU [Moraxellaceae bacterium]
QFNAELEDIRSNFLTMGGMVEKQVVDAIQSLLDADSNLAEKVQAADKQINQMERQIDEELVRILARRQPAASDLRFIIAIGKSITDLERIGDEAAKVARYALALTEEGESPRGYTESRHIGNQVRVMVHDALDAFARFDAELAFRVMQDDNVIDSEYKTALRALMTYMMEDPRSISRVLNVMWVLRSLERIGDHARNISEQLIFLVKGSDVRHTSYDEVERQLNLKKK